MNKFLCFLDKQNPPSHSFVDGFLSQSLAKEKKFSVELYVSNTKKGSTAPYRYFSAVCIAALYPRRMLGRLLNLPLCLYIIYRRSGRLKKKGSKVTVFVRNDPVFLLAASFLRYKYDCLIYQSSFPHEEYSDNIFKRYFAKSLIKAAGRNVDSILGVSPLGVQRIKKLIPSAKKSCYIPLLPDSSFFLKEEPSPTSNDVLTFIYIGSHNEKRGMDVVIGAVVEACKSRDDLQFIFLGGSEDEISILKNIPGVVDLVEKKIIYFEGKVDRSLVPSYLRKADVGLCLIPPDPIYYEASPTKLAEYMGMGLSVIASKGIPLQEEFIKNSKSGVVIDFDILEIEDALVSLESEIVDNMKYNALAYSRSEMGYGNYVIDFKSLCSND